MVARFSLNWQGLWIGANSLVMVNMGGLTELDPGILNVLISVADWSFLSLKVVFGVLTSDDTDSFLDTLTCN